jgi:hypothetical protein
MSQFPVSQLEEKSEAIQKDIQSLHDKASQIVISSQDGLSEASNFLGAIKTRLKRLEEMRKFDVGPLNDHVKALNNKYKVQSEPLLELEVIVKNAIKKYMDAEDLKARQEAERLRKEQEQRELEERKKIEEARKKEEEARQAELKAKLAAEEAKTAKEKELANKAAEEARLKAEQEALKVTEAEKQLDMTAIQLVEEPEKSVRTEAGLVTRKMVWTWQVEDESTLRKAHPELFIIDEKAINKLVKDGARNIAGLKIYQESNIAVR